MAGELTNIDGKPKAVAKSAAGKGRAGKGGRPSSYNQDLADEICAQLAEGMSLRSILKANTNYPAMATIFNWLRTNEEFLEQYTRAKTESADALADNITDIAAQTLKGTHDPQSARVAMDGYKWVASKLKPKVYGDKLDLTTGNEKLNRGMSDAELNAILARAGSTPDQAGASPEVG
jgi:hypothetical protein